MQGRGDAREFPQHIFPGLNPLWPCGTPGRDGAEAAAKAAASPGSNPPPRGSRGAGSACPVTR